MEQHLFDWEEWSHDETFVYTFHGVTLKVPIGHLTAGAKFADVTMDYNVGSMTLYNFGEPDESGEEPVTEVYEFKLTLQVGNSNVAFS